MADTAPAVPRHAGLSPPLPRSLGPKHRPAPPLQTGGMVSGEEFQFPRTSAAPTAQHRDGWEIWQLERSLTVHARLVQATALLRHSRVHAFTKPLLKFLQSQTTSDAANTFHASPTPCVPLGTGTLPRAWTSTSFGLVVAFCQDLGPQLGPSRRAIDDVTRPVLPLARHRVRSLGTGCFFSRRLGPQFSPRHRTTSGLDATREPRKVLSQFLGTAPFPCYRRLHTG